MFSVGYVQRAKRPVSVKHSVQDGSFAFRPSSMHTSTEDGPFAFNPSSVRSSVQDGPFAFNPFTFTALWKTGHFALCTYPTKNQAPLFYGDPINKTLFRMFYKTNAL